MVVSSIPLTEARPSVALVPTAGERQGGPGTAGRAAGLLSSLLSPWPRWFWHGRGARCCTAAAFCTGGSRGNGRPWFCRVLGCPTVPSGLWVLSIKCCLKVFTPKLARNEQGIVGLCVWGVPVLPLRYFVYVLIVPFSLNLNTTLTFLALVSFSTNLHFI